MSKRVIIAGEAAFVDIFKTLCAGHDTQVYYVNDLDVQENLDRLVNDVATCDVFIESLNESPASKLWLIEGVEVNLRDNAMLLSNTLCSSPTEVASWCSNPRRMVGIGLLPPVKIPTLIEFAPALQTSVEIATTAREFFQRMNCEIVRVPDTPGLVRARLLMTLINEAIFVLDQKIASAEDIDTAMKLTYNLPMGPLAWADEIGLDVVLGSLTGMYDFWSEERYRPAPLLKQKVRARHLGKKVGRGFFVDAQLVQSEI
jgi:3-hydroxybutyryl-CoA dehydrogenase